MPPPTLNSEEPVKEGHAHLRPTYLKTSVDHDRGAINAALTTAISLWRFCLS